MADAPGGTGETLPLTSELITVLESDVVSITHDSEFVYAACQDNNVRVWSKSDWQLVATLGETSTPPLRVHVDKEHIYATCEKRVYVWNRVSWGMVGWFELSYGALTSVLYEDSFLVGAREGRLVSINKNTHETSSWQLYKSDVTSIWTDNSIICTAARKDECRVWTRQEGKAPVEIAKLEKKGRCTAIVGTNEYVILGMSGGEVQLWDRLEWTLIKTLEAVNSHAVTCLWSNNHYLIIGLAQNIVTIYDLKGGSEIGRIQLDGQKIEAVDADHDRIYIATSEGIHVGQLLLGGSSVDLDTDVGIEFGRSLLKTSPYDVLEIVLTRKQEGDALLQAGEYHDAVAAYENALQLLIDNTHALLEVPKEREEITEEVNRRLGRALLHSKILELQALSKRIEQISDEFDMRGRTEIEESEMNALWAEARRAIKEARVLAEAQAGDMLSYQLTFIADTLEDDLAAAEEKANRYKEKVNQARAMVSNIMAEWRWMERRRTTLEQRQSFLESAINRIELALKDTPQDDQEVISILSKAITEYKRLLDQISRIISAADSKEAEELRSREEAISAIAGLLKVMPKKRDVMLSISDVAERKREYERLMSALRQALETANKFKLKEEARNIVNEIESLEGLNGSVGINPVSAAKSVEGAPE
ncbi:MAG: hypothetical protein ACTSYL_05580 [Candidatus Thorarchaeota archaeon]